jgi:hypothetical protein
MMQISLGARQVLGADFLFDAIEIVFAHVLLFGQMQAKL